MSRLDMIKGFTRVYEDLCYLFPLLPSVRSIIPRKGKRKEYQPAYISPRNRKDTYFYFPFYHRKLFVSYNWLIYRSLKGKDYVLFIFMISQCLVRVLYTIAEGRAEGGGVIKKEKGKRVSDPKYEWVNQI